MMLTFFLLSYFTVIQSTLCDNIMYSFFLTLFLVVINKITPKLHKTQEMFKTVILQYKMYMYIKIKAFTQKITFEALPAQPKNQ